MGTIAHRPLMIAFGPSRSHRNIRPDGFVQSGRVFFVFTCIASGPASAQLWTDRLSRVRSLERVRRTMGHGLGRSAFLSLAVTIVSLPLISPPGAAATRIFLVATDSAVGKNSLGIPGSQDVIRDPFGKYLAVYV